MRYRKLLLILSIVTLSLTACKKEQNLETTETTAIEENTVEAETTDDNAVTVENTEEKIMESETEIADDIEKSSEANPLDPTTNITKNADGTFSYTDEFLNAIMSYDYFEGATDEEIKMALDFWGDDLVKETPERIHSLFEDMSKNGGRASEIFSAPDHTTSNNNTTNNSNSNNTNNQSNDSTGNNQQGNTSTGVENQVQESVGTMDSFFGQDYGFGVGGEQIDSGIVIQ